MTVCNNEFREIPHKVSSFVKRLFFILTEENDEKMTADQTAILLQSLSANQILMRNRARSRFFASRFHK